MGVARGLQVGLFGTICFFLVITTTIEQVGVAPAFVLGLAATFAVQMVSLRVIRRPIEPSVSAP